MPIPFSLKHFAHPDFSSFKKTELDPIFDRVHYVKPESSRSESSEGFYVCLGFRPERGQPGKSVVPSPEVMYGNAFETTHCISRDYE
jgi:hypothetical protein